jgi:cytochrome c oxidase subunit 1
MFVIGGLSGVTHSVVPADTQQHDTYYVVAHFHYVLFGGAVLGLFAGLYYWWPKITGRLLDERLGKWNFWVMFIGFNMTFGPMHVLGLNGMPRRTYTYPRGLGFEFWNLMATVGAFLIALSVAIFLWNAIRTRTKGEIAGADPWDGRTLEWSTPSPTPVYNFAEVPHVETEDAWWHAKYTEDDEGHAVARSNPPDPEAGPTTDIHLPSPSYYPALAAFGLFLIILGLVYMPVGLVLSGAGMGVTLWGLFGWSLEPLTKESPDAGHPSPVEAPGSGPQSPDGDEGGEGDEESGDGEVEETEVAEATGEEDEDEGGES